MPENQGPDPTTLDKLVGAKAEFDRATDIEAKRPTGVDKFAAEMADVERRVNAAARQAAPTMNEQLAALAAAKRGAGVATAYSSHEIAVAPELARYPVNPPDLAQIAAAFGHNPAPDASQAVRMQAVRDLFSALGLALSGLCPRGRLYALGFTDLERASASFIKAIASELPAAQQPAAPPAP
jgi:hypothetical protein